MRLLAGHDAVVAEFVARLAPIEVPVWTNMAAAFGVIRDDGALVAGVVFDDWRPDFGTLQMSAAAVTSLAFRPQIVAEIGAFVFGKRNGVYRLWARTSIRNERAQRMLTGLGFTREAVSSHHYGPKHHATLWRLLRPEWEARSGAKLQMAA